MTRPRVITMLRTALALGPASIARVVSYRVRLRLGVHPVQRVRSGPPPVGPFFERSPRVASAGPPAILPTAWPGPHGIFSWFAVPLRTTPPAWFTNPLTGSRATGADRAWWEIPDFDPSVGDIKGIWEASRFDWVVRFALRDLAGDDRAVDDLNAWLIDWCNENPAYLGSNWKCGQEASIRLMHLAVAAHLLDAERRPTGALVSLIDSHLTRIDPTLSYALGQDNNHGTSEAAALFIGGSWLARLGDPRGERFAARGRAALEERAKRLILPDGTFSQYSVNYHRLVVETYCLAELWCRALALSAFSADLRVRLSAAVDWLAALVEPGTGDVPNVGANDGANLLPLTDAPYRDFRQSVQLGGALFQDRRYFTGVAFCDAHLSALGVTVPAEPAPPPASRASPNGGFIVLRRGAAMSLFRVPRHRFRPGHADPLHVDLWVGASNHLRDDGSYGYNSDGSSMAYFGTVQAHNTVQFDDLEPMPRLGRFLWGDWVQASEHKGPEESAAAVLAEATYSTSFGATHSRAIELRDTELHVTDRVRDFAHRAVCRWRLQPGSWTIEGLQVRSAHGSLRLSANVPIVRLMIVPGWESRHYAQRTEIPVVEIELATAGTLRSVYQWYA